MLLLVEPDIPQVGSQVNDLSVIIEEEKQQQPVNAEGGADKIESASDKESSLESVGEESTAQEVFEHEGRQSVSPNKKSFSRPSVEPLLNRNRSTVMSKKR